MSKKNRKVKLLTALLTAVMIISFVMTVHLSANEEVYYGQSPSINNTTVSLDLGIENLLNQSVMYKLPDTIKVEDDISIIIQTKSTTLLDAYDKSGSSLSFTEYSLTSEAAAIREQIAAESMDVLDNLTNIDYQLGENYDVVMAGFEIVIKAKDFVNIYNVYNKSRIEKKLNSNRGKSYN